MVVEMMSTMVAIHAPKSGTRFDPDNVLRSIMADWSRGVRSMDEVKSEQMQATMAQVVQGAQQHGK